MGSGLTTSIICFSFDSNLDFLEDNVQTHDCSVESLLTFHRTFIKV